MKHRVCQQSEFIARCDKFQSYMQLRCVIFALRQVICFCKQKRYMLRLRRNVKENAARFDFIMPALVFELVLQLVTCNLQLRANSAIN